ncbi:uncharacterized protein LOC127528732 [Erpetoichthys calabaricus]|uniref:uncharacterized protein LOC127528732 n=1 Tax=Erpetoichthys calabaricus TaxID=27687 RepID=UPI002234B34E|nr:uncharacterized protein LOC127528732 [Erpetoichthys calabaricus]
MFAEEYQFTHVTSSPRYPQANGEAERAVRTIKDLWKKDPDHSRALLAYRATPLEHGFSPAQLLMGRNLRTSLPQPTAKMDPQWPDLLAFRKKDEEGRRQQAKYYNRRHRSRPLSQLTPGQKVWITTEGTSGAVVRSASTPRSYVVETDREIVGGEPLISEIFNRWPALFTERQISAEFKRIVTTDLLQPFLEGLDGLVPRLLEVYKAAAMSGRKLSLKSILQCLEKDDTNQKRRTAALLGLPYYISEDPSGIIKTCDAHGEQLDVIMKGMQVGLLIGHEGVLQDAFPHELFNVAVVVEETIILHSLQNVPEGFAMLMGIIYCFNLEYPQKMKYTFEFLQRVVMQIKPDQGSVRIHGLRNKLLRYRV